MHLILDFQAYFIVHTVVALSSRCTTAIIATFAATCVLAATSDAEDQTDEKCENDEGWDTEYHRVIDGFIFAYERLFPERVLSAVYFS